MDYTHFMVMTSSLLIGNAVLFSAFLLLEKRHRKHRQIQLLVAFMLLAFALRIMKSVIYILFPEYGSTLTSIGIVGMLAIGPLYLLYMRAMLAKTKMEYLHFIPALIVFWSIPWLKGDVLRIIYLCSLLHLLVYFLRGTEQMYRNRPLISKPKNRRANWLIQLMAAMFLIWIGFMLQAIVVDKMIYVGITFAEVIVFFTISVIAKKNYGHIMKPIYLSSSENPILKILAEHAIVVLKEDKLYTKSDLTISKLAKKLDASSHTLSKALNQIENKSFPELLGSVRIEYSIELLKDIRYKNLSIEAIAFESGFNSLSVFYDNFKKYNGLTPAAYRKKHEDLARS